MDGLDRWLGDSRLWVVDLPMAGALSPWLLFWIAPRNYDNTFIPPIHFLIASVPLLGLLAAAAFLTGTHQARLLGALVPPAIAVACFSASEVIIGIVNDGELEFTTRWYGDVQLVGIAGGLLMPVTALAGCIFVRSRSR